MGKDDNEFGLKTQLEQLGVRNRPATAVVAIVTEDADGKVTVEPTAPFVSPLISLLDLEGTGRSISMTDKERKLFMTQFKTYIKKNNKIKTMKQYVKYIMKHQNEFMNKTVNRAETYLTM